MSSDIAKYPLVGQNCPWLRVTVLEDLRIELTPLNQIKHTQDSHGSKIS